jgi:hypothetical protein
MDDLISRQAAIDALGEKPLAWTEGEYELGLQNQWQSDVDALNGLPSAQPEIIHCRDCKHWTNNVNDSELRDNFCNEAVHGFYYRCSGDDYCSFAERKEDE